MSIFSLRKQKDIEFEKKSEEQIVKKGKKIKKSKNPTNNLLAPYMKHLGISTFNATPLDYYKGENKIYIIETDFLETYVLKIFSKDAYDFAASIEKHFINSAKNISKLTSQISVSHDKDDELEQFLFTDRLPGANKKWTDLNADQKSDVTIELARIMYKIHTYNSKRTMGEDFFGKVSNKKKKWEEYINEIIEEKISFMEKESSKSEIIKFKKYCETKLTMLASHKIAPCLLHGSINVNEKGFIRSLLFLGNRISAVLNSEESIYGDKVWDLVPFYHQILSKNKELEKDFFREYGKLKTEEKERLDFYDKIIFG